MCFLVQFVNNIANANLISALKIGKSAVYLLIIQSFLDFPLIPWEDFSLFLIEVLKVLDMSNN